MNNWIWGEDPEIKGCYAVLKSWDREEGCWPDSVEWNGENWELDTGAIVIAFYGPFQNKEEAKKWACDNDLYL
jgi:hypothetical protein